MKLLIFSDIHSDWKALERLLDVDADSYFAAGDMVSWRRGLSQAGEMLSRRAGKVYVLPGNHESEQDIAGMCAQYGLNNFHGQCLEESGYHIAGLGYSNPTPFHTPGEYSEGEIASRLVPFADKKPLILICHCPPKGTLLDQAGEKRHYGSTAVKEFLDQNQPPYFFCGHIHEAEGAQERMGSTLGVNVGKRGYLLDFDKMVFS